MVEEKKEASDFIKEQYVHLNAHRSQVNTLSGQIIGFIFAGLVLSLGLKSENIADWNKFPLLPAISFLAIGVFFVVMWTAHTRNIVSRRWLDKLIEEMEEEYGRRPADYGLLNSPRGRRWLGEDVSSSFVLSVFLMLMAVLTLSASGYFWIKLFHLK